jgi:hypothetical protein
MVRVARAKWAGVVIAVAAAITLVISAGEIAYAEDPIVLDGQFDDWVGEGWVDDLAGDSLFERGEITRIWWADNEDEESVFWRIDRVPDQRSVTYVVGVDANNDGNVDSSSDRLINVYYAPLPDSSIVHVVVDAADTNAHVFGPVVTDSGLSDEEGGASVEISVPIDVLGLSAHQPARFYIWSKQGQLIDRVPNNGDVQWTPVDVLGKVLLSLVFVVGLGVIWIKRGRTAWAH